MLASQFRTILATLPVVSSSDWFNFDVMLVRDRALKLSPSNHMVVMYSPLHRMLLIKKQFHFAIFLLRHKSALADLRSYGTFRKKFENFTPILSKEMQIRTKNVETR